MDPHLKVICLDILISWLLDPMYKFQHCELFFSSFPSVHKFHICAQILGTLLIDGGGGGGGIIQLDW